MMKAWLLVALLGAAAAVPQRGQRIVGGSATNISRYPFMVSMQYNWWGQWYQSCGGALLTSTSVLSAAHCYHGDSANLWRVQVGSSYPETGGTIRTLSRIINHSGYNPNTLNNDVSILRLAQAVPLGANVAVATIAGANYNLADNTAIWAVGWGILYQGGPSPTILHHVQVNTINWNLCAQRYAYLKSLPGYQSWPDITPQMACAGALDQGGRDACQGDSGGPVVHNGNVVYGVTSWGFGCADPFYPGVNAHVPALSTWIVANAS